MNSLPFITATTTSTTTNYGSRLLVTHSSGSSPSASSHSLSLVVLSVQRRHCWQGWPVGCSISQKCWSSCDSIPPKCWSSLGSPRAGVGGESGSWVGASSLNRRTRLPSAAATGRRSSASSGGGKGEFRMTAQLSSSESVEAVAVERCNGEKGIRVGAVFFDMDDTLVLTHEIDRQAQSLVMDRLGVRAPQVNQAAVLTEFIKQFGSQAWDPEHKVEVTEWRAGLWGKALAGQGVDDMELARDLQNCFDTERLRAFRWTTNVERLVRNLHGQGIKVGIITNGHAKVQRAKLKACNANELFDTILVGGEEPNEKPHRDIFLKACKLAGCKPEESVMVGDTLQTDIQGGLNAGFLSTIWVNVHKKERPLAAAKPDHEIATFSELQQVLKQLGVDFDEA